MRKLALSRSSTPITVMSCVVLVTMGVVSDTTANLGESLSAAQARSHEYGTKYKAIALLFITDSRGVVVSECWDAPGRNWNKQEAMNLATDLLPKGLKKETPSPGGVDGMYEPYTFSDGTMIILTGGFSALNGKYIGVEVRAPGYTGPRC